MARLQLSGITKRYGEFKAADDVSLDIADGEFLVLLGPSGCGKTTTLRVVAGFIEPTSGSVRLGGRDITALPPWKRNAGLVFQSYALFPHMTVAEMHAARRRLDEASDDAQGRGLATAGRAEQDQEFAIGNVERDVVGGLELAIALGDAAELQTRHVRPRGRS